MYLPERMSEAEITAAVQAIVAEVGATGPGDMGKVMGKVKEHLGWQGRYGLGVRRREGRLEPISTG